LDIEMADPQEYVSHNFGALNRHIDEVVQRDRVLTGMRRANVFSIYAKYGGLLALGLGVMALLVFWGISMLIERPEPQIIEKEIVVKEPISLQPNIYVNSDRQADLIARERSDAERRAKEIGGEVSENDVPRKIVVDYVLFRRTPFEAGGINKIVVGMKFKNAAANNPYHQWCYIENLQASGINKTIQLGVKAEDHVTMQELTDETAREFGANLDIINKAQKLCVFR
jgi:hypothetical protein